MAAGLDLPLAPPSARFPRFPFPILTPILALQNALAQDLLKIQKQGL